MITGDCSSARGPRGGSIGARCTFGDCGGIETVDATDGAPMTGDSGGGFGTAEIGPPIGCFTAASPGICAGGPELAAEAFGILAKGFWAVSGEVGFEACGEGSVEAALLLLNANEKEGTEGAIGA